MRQEQKNLLEGSIYELMNDARRRFPLMMSFMDCHPYIISDISHYAKPLGYGY